MENEKLITVREAAARLALSTSTIRAMLRTGVLARVKIGFAVRVREGDIEALVRVGLPGPRKGRGKVAGGE